MRNTMRNKFLACFLMLMLAIFLVPRTSSATFLNNWYFDLDGSGPGNRVQIDEFLDIVGPAYIVNTLSTSTSGTFQEWGAMSSIQHDGGKSYGNPIQGGDSTYATYEITSTFTGAGNINLTTGSLEFTSGTLDMYVDSSQTFGTDDGSSGFIYGADDGTYIGSLNLISGDGSVDTLGVPNGMITTIWEFTSLLEGYLIDPDGVTDLASLSPITLLLGYGTTNASYVANPDQEVINEIAGQFAGVPTPPNSPPGDLFVSANGQFRNEVVPEPATMLLLGSGLIGLAGLGRRKLFKK